MIIVSVAFVICWFPTSIYFVVVDITSQMSNEQFVGYHATLFLSYLYICRPTCGLLLLVRFQDHTLRLSLTCTSV